MAHFQATSSDMTTAFLTQETMASSAEDCEDRVHLSKQG